MCFLGSVQCYVPKPVKRLENPSQISKASETSKQEDKAPSALYETKAVSAQPGRDSSQKTKDEGERTYLQFRAGNAPTATGNSNIPPMGRNTALDLIKSENLHETWDGWPNGDFDLDIDHTTFEVTKKLIVHWSMKVNGGDKIHSAEAETWQAGKRSTRLCLGHMECDKETCHIIIRPKIDKPSREKQLAIDCRCGGNMVWKPCPGGPGGKGVRSVLHHWSGGVHYSNGGYHRHPRLTHEIHLTPKAELEFRELASSQPHLKALALIVGHPTLQGPHGKSVADIATSLTNSGRVQYERNKIRKSSGKKGTSTDQHFLDIYSGFSQAHPDFIIRRVFREVIVISLQSAYMSSTATKDTIIGEPVNGMVSDAAHGWWRKRTSLLIVTSTYSTILMCWVPALFSYSNGASKEHYMHHFYALFKSMAKQAEKTNTELTDEILAQVRMVPCLYIDLFLTKQNGGCRFQ